MGGAAAALLVASLPWGGVLAQGAADPKLDDDRVVAIVDGKELRRSDVVASAATLPEAYRQQIDELFPALVERLIDLNLLVNEGRRLSLHDDGAVKARVARCEELAIREALLEGYLAERATGEAVEARYERFLEETPPQLEVRARHILTETEAAAKKVIAELAGGADFAELAAKQTIDTAAAANGGDLGYFTAEQMVPEFSEAAFMLAEGEYTKEPVKTRFGWHVVKVEDRREKAPPGFAEARERVTQQLTQEIVGQLLALLRGQAKIEKFNADGTPILPPEPAPAEGGQPPQ